MSASLRNNGTTNLTFLSSLFFRLCQFLFHQIYERNKIFSPKANNKNSTLVPDFPQISKWGDLKQSKKLYQIICDKLFMIQQVIGKYFLGENLAIFSTKNRFKPLVNPNNIISTSIP